jgi:flagellar hook-basal body complex protein FliE
VNNQLGQLIGADLMQIKANVSALSGEQLGIASAQGVHAGAAASGFADRMMEAMRGVNQQDQDAADKMALVDSGASDDLVGAMLSSQEASLSFSMLMQVRNKVMGAVEDLIKLPI